MESMELQLSQNTTGEVDSSNPAIRFVRSRVGATFLLFVSLLWPIESFSQTCALKSSPICLDSTPCKMVVDTAGNNVMTCLSNAVAPVGALVVPDTCWQYSAVYDCITPATPAYNDTCAPIKADGTCTNYTEKSVICNPNEPLLAGGACPLFDVTYQCDVSAPQSYTQTTCGSGPTCVDSAGNPTICTGPVNQEQNKAFGTAVTGAEAARQAGVYLDTGVNPGQTDMTQLTIFKGEQNRCSQGMWGMAPNCCKRDSRGASITNALVAQEVVGAGWNAINAYLGTGYAYDSLLTKTVDVLQRGVKAIEETYNTLEHGSTVLQALQNGANTLNATQQAANAASNPGTVVNGAAMVGGYIGGAAGGAAGSYIAQANGANTGWSGTIGALGTAAGTVAGTYAGTYAATFISTYATAGATLADATAAAGASIGSTGSAVSAVCWVCLVIMIIVTVIMSFAACSPEDMQTQLKLGAPGLCHFVGTYCNTKDLFGGCITTMQQYCCYNSRLARIIQEGAKSQLGTTWGSPQSPDCSGIKVSDLANIDFSKIDMSEFVQDVQTRAMPTVAAQAAQVQAVTGSFMAANGYDPTATGGHLITTGGQLPVLAPVDLTGTPSPTPAMMPCQVAFQVTGIAPDGSETGTFSVSQCNPSAVIVWANQSNCTASPATSMDPTSPYFTTSTVDASGNATFTVNMPASCLISSTPAIQNLWKGNVTLSPYGTIGGINAVWK